jgi:hypothetical protein
LQSNDSLTSPCCGDAEADDPDSIVSGLLAHPLAQSRVFFGLFSLREELLEGMLGAERRLDRSYDGEAIGAARSMRHQCAAVRTLDWFRRCRHTAREEPGFDAISSSHVDVTFFNGDHGEVEVFILPSMNPGKRSIAYLPHELEVGRS